MIKNRFSLVLILLIFSAVINIQAQDGPADEQNSLQNTEENLTAGENAQPLSEEEMLIFDPETTPQDELDTPLNTFSLWDFVRMIIVLAGVLGFIYLIFFFLKKFGSRKVIQDSVINILATQNLEANRSLHLVEIGPQVFLIGSGEGAVQLISEITDQETIDTIRLDQSTRAEGKKSFTATFMGMFERKEGQAVPDSGGGSGFLQKQKERLKKM